ncbi:MAG: hypothetical protein ACRBN8_15990 [Nannocystales bacterium]
MNAAILLSVALVSAVPQPSEAPPQMARDAELETKRRTGRIMLGLLPVSFAAFGGVHTFGYGLRQGWVPCKAPGNARVKATFEAVLCIGVPGKVELVASGAPATLAAIAAHDLAEVRLHEGHKRWRRPATIAALVTGSVLIAGGFGTVVLSLVAEDPVFRSGSGWGWPFWTHVAVAQSGAVLMAAGGALVGTGTAHLPAGRRTMVRVGPGWGGRGVVVSGRF